ncbi:msha pilin protein mshc [Catenovulum agarivorans DS-2]|uniref:Msha pilin protein mshc n=1 Tax=Catenovulum agarivorans DS-2 TaxID=1328313 RepID=W7Q9U4_9ALTE|nr:prepilin-type N-terminal cleavage/methylation domain-containing protein [Catenovulum agarivorans]EWH08751.1 msha pilin protein mshc [Catenovulum agarivorans DS-2]
MSKPHCNTGFTLVELIVVLVLIGIIAVAAFPKIGLVQSDSYTTEFRDRLLNVLRHSQLQAMQNTTGSCHQVIIVSTRFGQHDCSNNALASSFTNDFLGVSETEATNANLAISANGQAITNSFDIRFNALGQPTHGCTGGCTIEIAGTLTATITIEPQGYIHR